MFCAPKRCLFENSGIPAQGAAGPLATPFLRGSQLEQFASEQPQAKLAVQVFMYHRPRKVSLRHYLPQSL